MANPLLMLKGDTLGKTVYNVLAAAAVTVIAVWFAFVLISGQLWRWYAGRQSDRADRAESAAQIATHNAASANAGAANAGQTRATMDAQRVNVHVTTEQAATRAESYDPTRYDLDDGAVPDELVRELEAARRRAGAAADRLRRESPG